MEEDLSSSSRLTCRSCTERSLQRFSALLSAAVCYVAAIAWILVAYGEMGLDASEARPIPHGWSLASFFSALICVTVGCVYGVYKLQKVKYRAVAREIEQMHNLMASRGRSGSDEGGGDRESTSGAVSASEDDLLQATIPAFTAATMHAAAYKELVVRKLRAEGMQQGTNLITDAWTFANMKMMTIFLRSCFLANVGSAQKSWHGLKELSFIWAYSLALFLTCVGLVAAVWEYPPRFIATSNKGFSTDRRARVELVAKNWSGGCAWLLAFQLVDTFEITAADALLGSDSWHVWNSAEGAEEPASRGTDLNVLSHWLLACVVFMLTGTALVFMDYTKRRRARRLKIVSAPTSDHDGRILNAASSSPFPRRCRGACCICGLIWTRADQVVSFISASLVWTGALALKHALDVSAGLHAGEYRRGAFVPAKANRIAFGFLYALMMLLSALVLGILVDIHVHSLLSRAVKASEQKHLFANTFRLQVRARA